MTGRRILIPIDDIDTPEAFKPLTDQQRLYVNALLENGGNRRRAALAAGIGVASPSIDARNHAADVRSYSWNSMPKIQRALKEAADIRLKGEAVMAASLLVDLASNEKVKPETRLKAAVRLLEHAGLSIIAETRHTHEHKLVLTRDEEIEQVRILSRQLGIDATPLLAAVGVRDAPVDAEFTEIVDWNEEFTL